MRKSRFTEEQIAMALRQGEAGTPVAEIVRKLGISEQTYYTWKKKYGGLGVPELRELKAIREENRRLKTLVADLSLDKTILQEALSLSSLEEIARAVPVVFPVHPRTAKAMEGAGLRLRRVRGIAPIPYKQMLRLQADAGLVLTDSGGIQEETKVLEVPCLTLRSTTERPITIEQGTNRLVPDRSKSSILAAFNETWGRPVEARRPEGWDGRAAHRILEAIHSLLGVA
jgi:UDP-N-acetylglucosamine 2-epimerase